MQAKMLRNPLGLLNFFVFLTPCACRVVTSQGSMTIPIQTSRCLICCATALLDFVNVDTIVALSVFDMLPNAAQAAHDSARHVQQQMG